MTTKMVLEYKRDGAAMTSSGRILSDESGLITEEGDFSHLDFRSMLKRLVTALSVFPDDHALDVVLQRTDRDGILPYKLDEATVKLMRTDPVAAIQAMEYHYGSPSTATELSKQERAPAKPQPIRAGHATLADAFGDVVYFKVRGHELECPGCGFWGMYISPGLLKDPDRAGEVVKTAFVCPKKCHTRFIVTCQQDWGYVDVEFLLEKTKLEAFFFPRAWNEGRPWVSRESLQKKHDEFKTEKERIPCSEKE